MSTRFAKTPLVTVVMVSLLALGLTSLLAPWSPVTVLDEEQTSSRSAAPSAPEAEEDPAAAPKSEQATSVSTVLLISIDGLTPRALDRLGRKRTPHLHRLMRQGASTLNARTMTETSVTLPNHTSMVTGRRIDADRGGHGVTWNSSRPRPRTVHGAAGERVDSVFSVVHRAGGSNAMFVQKRKFKLWKRSWPKSIDRYRFDKNSKRLVRDLRKDLRERDREVRFLHLWGPDANGHKHGWMSKQYLAAVRRADARVGEVMKTVNGNAGVKGRIAVVLTSDHGGKGKKHSNADSLSNNRIPFIVRGPGVPRGADLYDLGDDLADPGRKQPSYDAAKPPVRNGAAANVVLQLLGLDRVRGSQFNTKGEVRLRR